MKTFNEYRATLNEFDFTRNPPQNTQGAGISLLEYVKEMQHVLAGFAAEYANNHKQSPEKYPIAMDRAFWDQQFIAFAELNG